MVLTEGEIVHTLLEVQIQIKLMHWVTTSYSMHKATDFLYSSIAEKTDTFVEALQGARKHRVKFEEKDIRVWHAYTSKDVKKDMSSLLSNFRKFLVNDLGNAILPTEPELKNLRDEMLSDVDQAIYLCSLE
jgi:hypothetical protein